MSGLTVANKTYVAQKLVKAMRESASVGWDLKGSVRATMRSSVQCVLARCCYPLGAKANVIGSMFVQAELFAANGTEA